MVIISRERVQVITYKRLHCELLKNFSSLESAGSWIINEIEINAAFSLFLEKVVR
jgi:hypothetical protein